MCAVSFRLHEELTRTGSMGTVCDTIPLQVVDQYAERGGGSLAALRSQAPFRDDSPVLSKRNAQ
jgi:hypothetical protein